MNASERNVSARCDLDTRVTSVLFPSLYGLLFLAAVVLNTLAAWIFFQIRSSSTFVVYLKNVVAADLLMTLAVPVKVLSDAGVGGTALQVFYCRYSAVLFYTTMYISILLLGLISLDRYLKIVRPFGRCALQRVGVGRALCVAVWVLMLGLALPNVILSSRPARATRGGGKLKCSSLKSELGLRWHEGFNYLCQVVFWGTLGLMVVCYTFISRKVYESYRASQASAGTATKRTKAKVFVVVGVFSVCFAPFHLARVPYTLTQTRSTSTRCWAQNQLYVAKETTLWLCATNVCLDPLIYVFLCRVFRRKLSAALCRRPMGIGESRTETSTKQESSHVPRLNKPLELSTY
ncbi:P2Y purinoceptor 13-like [Brachyhypopomus gauderio]|uniref:P2Y purinoceptor 13-like n=1 Tax=Brachyhypopomus gauderio TaxID=698409 RepID=UPI0040421BA9